MPFRFDQRAPAGAEAPQTRRRPTSARLLLAATCALALSPSAAPLPPRWSMNAVVNRDDGVVTVWRRAEYASGAFNGFDRDAVVIARARYRAALLDGSRPAARPLEVDYSYSREAGLTPDPVFTMDGAGRVSACTQAGHCLANPRLRIWQLGRRGEAMRLDGMLLVLERTGGERCAVDLRVAADAAGAVPKFGAAYFPSAQLLYLAGEAAGKPLLYASQRCGPLQAVDMRALTRFSDGVRRGIEVRDVVAGADPARPAVLLDWSQQENGVYVPRAGVLDLASGHAYPLDPAWRHPLGFWRASPKQVLVAAEDAVTGDVGRARLTIVDLERGSTSTREAVVELD